VSGDVSADSLDISTDDERMLTESVEIVFHCAAIVRFDLTLIEAMKTNVRGTHRVLQLAEKMKQLKSFVFVSTAFSQSYQTCLEEKYYSTGFDVFALIDFVKSNDKHSIDNVEKE
jgi:alcohol-forming fatty acyl-CoA reductase